MQMNEIAMPWKTSRLPVSCVFLGLQDGSVRVTSGNRSDPLANPCIDTRFSWGHSGRGAIVLATALLARAIEDDRIAVALAAPFARATLAMIPEGESWAMSDTIVRAVAASLVTA